MFSDRRFSVPACVAASPKPMQSAMVLPPPGALGAASLALEPGDKASESCLALPPPALEHQVAAIVVPRLAVVALLVRGPSRFSGLARPGIRSPAPHISPQSPHPGIQSACGVGMRMSAAASTRARPTSADPVHICPILCKQDATWASSLARAAARQSPATSPGDVSLTKSLFSAPRVGCRLFAHLGVCLIIHSRLRTTVGPLTTASV